MYLLLIICNIDSYFVMNQRDRHFSCINIL